MNVSSKVTAADREHFVTQGYSIFPNVVPKEALNKGKILVLVSAYLLLLSVFRFSNSRNQRCYRTRN